MYSIESCLHPSTNPTREDIACDGKPLTRIMVLPIEDSVAVNVTTFFDTIEFTELNIFEKTRSYFFKVPNWKFWLILMFLR